MDDRNPWRISGRWTYWRCRTCGGRELVPMPSPADLDHYYNHEYRVLQPDGEDAARDTWALFLNRLEALVSDRSLLEIGCSYGGFLAAAQQRGWDVAGMELSSDAAAVARARGLDVITGSWSGCADCWPAERWGAVCLWHVLEHIPDLSGLMQSVHRLLRPGGIVMLRTPNVASLGARLLRSRWEWSLAPAHVRLWSLDGLRHWLTDNGFEPPCASFRRGDARTLLSQMTLAAAHRLLDARSNDHSPGPWRTPRMRSAKYVLLRTLDRLGAPLDAALGLNGGISRSAELVIWARKPSYAPLVASHGTGDGAYAHSGCRG